jgi:hypothetical protein
MYNPYGQQPMQPMQQYPNQPNQQYIPGFSQPPQQAMPQPYGVGINSPVQGK